MLMVGRKFKKNSKPLKKRRQQIYFSEMGSEASTSASINAHNLIYYEVSERRVLQFKDHIECSQKINQLKKLKE